MDLDGMRTYRTLFSGKCGGTFTDSGSRGKWLMLHVPVKQENSDARTAKERMKEGCRVCGVRFTNTDSFAVCSVLDEQSRPVSVKNCHGGNAYRHHCKTLLKK